MTIDDGGLDFDNDSDHAVNSDHNHNHDDNHEYAQEHDNLMVKVSVRSTVRVILRPIMSSLPFIGGVEVPKRETF